jgi:formylglycine-generating enzyme required for sulfatase activity
MPGVEYCEKYLAGKAVCKGKEVPKHFCIDTYEYPNRVGELPRVMVSWREADEICRAEDKRLCDDDEWTLACEGPERTPYPYGWERDETICNIGQMHAKGPRLDDIYSKDPAVAAAELARIDLREKIGEGHPMCVSPFGVHDMTGNVDEWARNVTMHAQPFVSLFKGGHYLGKVRNRCRPATTFHDPDFLFYVEGFRCCANAKK